MKKINAIAHMILFNCKSKLAVGKSLKNHCVPLLRPNQFDLLGDM